MERNVLSTLLRICAPIWLLSLPLSSLLTVVTVLRIFVTAPLILRRKSFCAADSISIFNPVLILLLSSDFANKKVNRAYRVKLRLNFR